MPPEERDLLLLSMQRTLIQSALDLHNNLNSADTTSWSSQTRQVFLFNHKLLKQIVNSLEIPATQEAPKAELALERTENPQTHFHAPPAENDETSLPDFFSEDEDELVNWEKQEEEALDDFDRVLTNRLTARGF